MLTRVDIPPGAWEARASLDGKSDADVMADPICRIANLYGIRDAAGRHLPFVPTPEQRQVIWAVHVFGWRSLLIPKARKLGVSTVLGVICADLVAWNSGVEVALIDKTAQDAEKKLDGIVRVALDSMAPEVRASLGKPARGQDNRSVLTLAAVAGDDKPSTMEAGISFRGSTPQLLWVSEWGAIQHDDPTRSLEIKTGAMEAARMGIRIVETTWKGGKGGDLWPYVQEALETAEERKGPQDWRLLFFPWHIDPRNVWEGDASQVSPKVAKYLAEKERELGLTFSPAQRLWYHKKSVELGIYITSENPTTLEECWRAPVAGAIYADLVDTARAEGRVRPFAWDRAWPVVSTWDVGWADSTSIWLFQIVGRDIHWIWHARREQHTAAQMVALMAATAIPVRLHLLPHDAAAKRPDEGKCYRDALIAAGLVNTVVVPRTPTLAAGINALRSLLSRSWFRLPECADGLAALEAYHTKDVSAGGVVTRDPVHDWSSHDSSAARIAAEAIELGMVEGAAARRMADAPPRYPDGSMADIDAARQARRRRRPGMALSGSSPMA